MSLYYTYDDAGNLSNIRYIIDSIGYQHNYYPVCNSRGDVETIYDYHGNVSAKYTYDAWGLIFSITDADGNEIYDEMHIGKLNPFRYRGYYYDTETGIYYLQSRYYVPFLRRFFNADSQLNPGTGLTGTNMFAYANNNPVKYSDSNGQLPFLAITGAIGAVIGAVAGGVIAKKTGRSVWKGAAIGAAGGALLGLGVGAGLGMISGAGALATAGKVVAGLGAIATGVSTAISSAAIPAEKAKQVFWAGGQAASKAADTFAKVTQTGSTIANTPIGKEIIAKTKNIPWAEAKSMWEAAPLQFAQHASGTVHAFIYAPNFSSSSIFMTTELPALLSNPNVKEIVITIFGG